MLLPLLNVLDQDSDSIVECAILRECDDNWTVRRLDPDHFDSSSHQFSRKAAHGRHWRILKSDQSAELIPGRTFDTACLTDRIVRENVETEVEQGNADENSAYKRILRALEGLIKVGEKLSDSREFRQGSPISGLLSANGRHGYVRRLDVLALEILQSASSAIGSDEYRRLTAGLKLYTHVDCPHSGPGDDSQGQIRVSMRIWGDQRDFYPEFVAAATHWLQENGLGRQP